MTRRIEFGKKYLVSVPISITLAALTITGLDVGIIDAEPISVERATVSITGLDVPIIDAEPISVQRDTMSITGLDVAVIDAEPISIERDTMSITGLDVSFADADTIQVTRDTMSITGLDVPIIDAEPIPVERATMSIVEVDVGIIDAEPISVERATVSITGLDVTIADGEVIPVTRDTMSITGLDVAVFAADVIPVTFDTMSITGLDVGIAEGGIIPVTRDTMSITGLDVPIIDAEPISVERATLTIASIDVAIIDAEPIPITRATLTITGLDVPILAAATLVIDTFGPQAASGGVPVEYTLTGAASQTYDVVGYPATTADPTLASQFNGGDANYTDLGQVVLTSGGSGINLTGPSGLDEVNYKVAYLPVGGADGDIVLVPNATVIDSFNLVLSVSNPADDATDVAVGANIILDFNDDVAATGTITLKLVGGAAVETFDLSTGLGDNGGTVTLSANAKTTDRVTLNPGADMAASTAHAINTSGLTDTNANPLTDIADDTTLNFTTAAGGGGETITRVTSVDEIQFSGGSYTFAIPNAAVNANDELVFIIAGNTISSDTFATIEIESEGTQAFDVQLTNPAGLAAAIVKVVISSAAATKGGGTFNATFTLSGTQSPYCALDVVKLSKSTTLGDTASDTTGTALDIDTDTVGNGFIIVAAEIEGGPFIGGGGSNNPVSNTIFNADDGTDGITERYYLGDGSTSFPWHLMGYDVVTTGATPRNIAGTTTAVSAMAVAAAYS